MGADDDRVGAEGQRIVEPQRERLGYERLDDLAPVGVPRIRRDDRAPVVEGTEGEVEVIEPRVDQLHRAHGRPGERGEVGVRARVTAEAVAREQDPTEGQRVAGTLEGDAFGQRVDDEPLLLEPLDVVRHLRLALGMAEAAGHELVAVHDARVGGEHEVGQVRVGLHHLDVRACGAERVEQALPLVACPLEVDLDVAVHPRVDLVEHVEVLGRAHQVAPAPPERSALDFGHGSRCSTRLRRKRPTSVTMPRA